MATHPHAFTLALLSTLASPALLHAQEPAGPLPPPAAEKRAGDPTRRVPPFFGQVGLTADQKEAIYKVRARHLEKINALESEVARLRAAMQADCEAALTPEQLKLLQTRRQASAATRRARAATPTAPTPTPGTRPLEKPKGGG